MAGAADGAADGVVRPRVYFHRRHAGLVSRDCCARGAMRRAKGNERFFAVAGMNIAPAPSHPISMPPLTPIGRMGSSSKHAARKDHRPRRPRLAPFGARAGRFCAFSQIARYRRPMATPEKAESFIL